MGDPTLPVRGSPRREPHRRARFGNIAAAASQVPISAGPASTHVNPVLRSLGPPQRAKHPRIQRQRAALSRRDTRLQTIRQVSVHRVTDFHEEALSTPGGPDNLIPTILGAKMVILQCRRQRF